MDKWENLNQLYDKFAKENKVELSWDSLQGEFSDIVRELPKVHKYLKNCLAHCEKLGDYINALPVDDYSDRFSAKRKISAQIGNLKKTLSMVEDFSKWRWHGEAENQQNEFEGLLELAAESTKNKAASYKKARSGTRKNS